MEQFFNKKDSALILKKFEIDSEKEQFSEEELFQLLADHIAYMIEYRIEFLLSLLYRLDVEEQKINQALHPAAPESANIGLARLVLERQKQRIYTKQTYQSKFSEDVEDWEF